MVWYWSCYWDNNSYSWKDSYTYRATSRVAWRKEKDAIKAAQAHEYRTGYTTKVIKSDGRRWRGKIR